jgi:UDP-N-acetylglucosamine 2-epimerase
MKKLKVLTVLGTRPEIIRLSRVMALLDRHCDHVVAHTGQNFDYELSEVFFEGLGIRRPDHFMNASGTVAETIGAIIAGTDRVLAAEKPEAVLLLGDTNSSLAVIAAKRRRIPTFHMEAGNRCFDQRVPEETNRRIVDHTADVNLTYSAIARDYLLREGLPPDRVIKVGSPMFEVLAHARAGVDASGVVSDLGLSDRGYFLVSAHREENIESPRNFAKLVDLLNRLAEDHGLPVIVSTHPRTRKKIDATGARFHAGVRLLKPLAFHDYVRLQLSARAVLSDSGTISEESSILNFPALNLREAHERPEAMEETAVMMVGLNALRIRQALSILDEQPRAETRGLSLVADYSAANVSDKVLRILHSYTDYVNQVVWRKGAEDE